MIPNLQETFEKFSEGNSGCCPGLMLLNILMTLSQFPEGS